jgi:hypothetical protein
MMKQLDAEAVLSRNQQGRPLRAPRIRPLLDLFFDRLREPGFRPGRFILVYDVFARGFIQNGRYFLKLLGFQSAVFFGNEILHGAPHNRFNPAVGSSFFLSGFDSFLCRFVRGQLILLNYQLKSVVEYKKSENIVN